MAHEKDNNSALVRKPCDNT